MTGLSCIHFIASGLYYLLAELSFRSFNCHTPSSIEYYKAVILIAIVIIIR